MTETIQILEAAMQRRLAAMPARLRLFTTERKSLPNTLLLIGPRGCGKSTFMLHHAQGKRILYFSADNPRVTALPLYDLVREIFMRGYDGVIIDEVHFSSSWSIHLKALYDDFPGKIIWASDSSSLVLRKGEADLSRRYVPIRMPLMSFREFLYLETGQEYPKYTLGDTLLPTEPTPDILALFGKYRQLGTRPFYQDGDFEARYNAILDKTLYNDIPFFIATINDNNLRMMKAVIGTLANSSIPRVQVNSLCADWNIGAEKLYQLLFVMENVDILNIVRLQNDKKARSVGAKMLFADPCAYHVLCADLGTEREAFVVNCFKQTGWTVEASRKEAEGDYAISKGNDTISVEVGGKRKKPKAAQWVLRDNTDYPAGNAIPFWLLAMMW